MFCSLINSLLQKYDAKEMKQSEPIHGKSCSMHLQKQGQRTQLLSLGDEPSIAKKIRYEQYNIFTSFT